MLDTTLLRVNYKRKKPQMEKSIYRIESCAKNIVETFIDYGYVIGCSWSYYFKKAQQGVNGLNGIGGKAGKNGESAKAGEI